MLDIIKNEVTEGFYYLSTPEEPEVVLVHCYKCTDCDGELVFGYNTHDGGGILLVSDAKENVVAIPVITVPKPILERGTYDE